MSQRGNYDDRTVATIDRWSVSPSKPTTGHGIGNVYNTSTTSTEMYGLFARDQRRSRRSDR